MNLRASETWAAAAVAAPADVILALTSLPPACRNIAQQQACIRSWRDAGARVLSFNHPSEIPALAALHDDVEFVPVPDTAAPQFGRHYVPINAMLERARQQDAPALLINADIELRLAPWELKRIRWLADGGLCYFVRHNHDGDHARAQREPYGIDAFLLHGRDAGLFRPSFLCMGQPFWDYWLPHAFAARGRRVCAVEFPAAYHRNHPRQWSFEAWHRCALEFDRMAGLLGADRSFQACSAMSVQVRAAFEEQRLPLSPRPPQIRDWVQARFAGNEPKTFLELGAHCGDDTAWMASLPGVTVHAFEPDPRNHPPPRPNVLLHRAAISDRDGRAPFLLSREGWGREWTYSSSIKQPKNHLRRYPVSFGETVEVETVTLDSHVHRHGIAAIDFIWADIQGAEGEMIRGGRRALERTRYLFTEYSDDEMYEGQPTLAEILRLLPGFRVLELWQDDVLLENRARA